MSVVEKLEADLELKASALKFLEIFSTRLFELANISPNIIQSVEIRGGEWGIPGFIFFLNYTLDGKPCVAKEVVEEINLVDLSLTFKVIEGTLLEEYKSFKLIFKLTPHILGGSVVHWTLEYEKLNEEIPDPNSLMQEVLQVSEDVDGWLVKLL